MSWTAPATVATNDNLTAAFWNAQVRDNMLETAAATADAAGDVVYADAANSMGSRLAHPGTGRLLVSGPSDTWVARQPAEDVNYSDGSTSGGTTVTSFSHIGGPGDYPSVTVTTGTAAIVVVSSPNVSNSSAGESVVVSFSISGATTEAASGEESALHQSAVADGSSNVIAVRRISTLTAGSNTFQMEARVTGGTGTIQRPRILVIPL